MREQDIQNLIRIEFSKNYPDSLLFRANVGTGWTGSHVRRNPDGSLTIFNPRPFDTGLPNGYSDLFGIFPGGRAAFFEVKTQTGRPSDAQLNFIEQVQRVGCPAGIVRSFEDVKRIIEGEK